MLGKAKEGMLKAIKHLELEFSKLQLGRANPAIVEDLRIEQYGSLQSLKNVSSISNMDSQTLSIKPWDRSIIGAIGKAITEAGLGLNPQSMADSIIIKIPTLTEERRVEITKIAKKMAEEAKIGVRNVRSEALKMLKLKEDEKEISEDELKDYEDELQKLVNDSNSSIESHLKKKQEDIMKV